MGLLSFAWQEQHGGEVPMPGKTHYQNQAELDKGVESELDKVSKTAEELPRILIIGALGRCGGGALSLCQNVGSLKATQPSGICQRPGSVVRSLRYESQM